MKRELDLIDVWFDSGSMPYAQWHYPFENQEKFKNNYPADFIAEGVDQTRGWFYTLHAIATMVFDSVAFKNVVSNGLVLDKNGQKMSKRLGNAVDPFTTLEKEGADVVRWYMMSNANPWDNLKFDPDALGEVKRKLFGTLYNTYSFFALYANIDGFELDEQNVSRLEERPEIDRWIISKLNSLVKDYTAAMDDYEVTRACRLVESFVVDQLSNWYVRLCRRRFWKGEMSDDKKAAYETLYQCLMVCSQLMSPVAPFISEWLYKNLSDGISEKAIRNNTPLNQESVHITLLTPVDEDHIDLALEERMDYAQRISSLVLSLRKKERIRVRQPLNKIMVPVLNKDFESQVEKVKYLILSEVNIKEIEYLYDSSGVIKKKIKPNFKTLGKRLGKHMKEAAAAISKLEQDVIARIENDNQYLLNVGEESFDLTLEDFEITTDDIPGWSVANDKDITVALDITLTQELLNEGLAREIVNRVQNIRKDIGLNVTDHILLSLENNDRLLTSFEKFGTYVAQETLADQIDFVDSLVGEPVEIYDDLSVKINVAKAN
jgi:isoleucyl-tRNA synthetase